MIGLLPLIERDLRIRFKTISYVIIQLIYPVIFVMLLGRSLSNLVGVITYDNVKIPYLLFIFPGILVVTALLSAVTAGAMLFTEKKNGMMHEIVMSPASSLNAYIFSKIISTSIISLIQIMLVTMLIYFIKPEFLSLGLILKSVILGFFASILFCSLSVALALIIGNDQAFSGLFSILIALMTYISAVLYPLEALPGDLKVFATYSPVTIMTELMRRTIFGVITDMKVIIYLVLLYIGYMSLFIVASAIALKRFLQR